MIHVNINDDAIIKENELDATPKHDFHARHFLCKTRLLHFSRAQISVNGK